MTIEQLRDEVVKRGKAAATRDYSRRPDKVEKLRGSLAGFDRAAQLPLMPEQWEAEIAKLEAECNEMRRSSVKEGYWEKRCFQAEIEWTFSVLCVAWKWGRSYSGRAMMTYADIVGVA